MTSSPTVHTVLPVHVPDGARTHSTISGSLGTFGDLSFNEVFTAANTRPLSSDINDLMFKWSSGIFGPPATTVLVHAVSASPSAWTAKFNVLSAWLL